MDYLNDKLENRAVIIKPDEGELVSFGDSSVRLQLTSEETNDQFGIYQIKLEGGVEGAKLHYHRFMDETFIVNEGTVIIQAGNQKYEATPGTMVYVPRFTPHAFKNDQMSQARITLIFNPAEKREGFFKGLHQVLNSNPVNPQDFLKLYNKYDSYPVDIDQMIPVRV